MSYIIMQEDTGFMDGCYQGRRGVNTAMKVWQERYPDSEFTIREVDKTPPAIYDNSRYLPNVYYGTTGGKS